jgi:hypothetical protein
MSNLLDVTTESLGSITMNCVLDITRFTLASLIAEVLDLKVSI